MHPILTIAIRAARKAGSIINRAALGGEGLKVQAKRANDFVTEVDQRGRGGDHRHRAQDAYPDHDFLAEESGAQPKATSEYVWIIDPLDGTTNFIHGVPHYCISIALMEHGRDRPWP